MVIEPLLREHLGQRSSTSNAALGLRSPVLEPDSQLVLAKAQLCRESFSPSLGQILVRLELVSQPLKLLAAEGSSGFLVPTSSTAG